MLDNEQNIKSFVSNCIEKYCSEHNYELRYDNSENSEYYFLTIDKNKFLKIRLSNHNVKEYCCGLNIRYDKIGKNTDLKVIKRNIYKRIDRCIEREKTYMLKKILNNIKGSK